MKDRSLLPALALGALLFGLPTHASSASDPRTPINALTTPGDADSVFRIDAPGSYYLEANLQGVAGKSGIEIMASDVHVDLMGFSLRGAAASLGAIRVIQEQNGITIENGTLSHWAGRGLDCGLAAGAQVRDLTVHQTERGGMYLGDAALVERCNVRFTDEFGIWTGAGSLVSNCTVSDMLSTGIHVGTGSKVRDCVVRICKGVGISLGSNSSVLACTVANSANGIISLGKLHVVDCHVSSSGSVGVQLATGMVRGCTITANGSHGIQATLGAHIVGNHVASNSGDGIRVQSQSRIEENDVRWNVNGAGVRVLGAGCTVVRNTLAANGTVLIVPNAGNFVGTLVFVNSINGRSDPWANIHSN